MNNNSKTNKRIRAKVVIGRLENYLKTGQYVLPDENGHRRPIPSKRLEQIKVELKVVKEKYQLA